METLLITTTTFPRWEGDTIPGFVHELARRLTDDYRVVVLAPHSPGAATYEVIDGVHVHRFRYFPERWQLLGESAILPSLKRNPLLHVPLACLAVAQMLATARMIRKEEVAKVQAHWIVPSGFLAFPASALLGVPYYIVSHGSDVSGARGWPFGLLKRVALRNCARAAAVSHDVRCAIRELSPPTEVDVIPMGVDTEVFTPERRDPELKRKHGVTGPLLLYVGRISKNKGLRHLLEAVPEIAGHFPDCRLLVVGYGEEENAMRALTRERDLGRHVEFLGALPHAELPPYYATADVFICPSLAEGFGLVVAEAMASGTATVATDLPAFREIIPDEQTGFIVPPRDAQQIARAVLAALSDEGEAVAQRGLARVREKFSWQSTIRRYLDHLGSGE